MRRFLLVACLAGACACLLVGASSAAAAQRFWLNDGAVGLAPTPTQLWFDKRTGPFLDLSAEIGNNAFTVRCDKSELAMRTHSNDVGLNRSIGEFAMFSGCKKLGPPDVFVRVSTTGYTYRLEWTATDTFKLTGIFIQAYLPGNQKCRWTTTGTGNQLDGAWLNGTTSEITFSGSNLTFGQDCTGPGSISMPYKMEGRSAPGGHNLWLN
jgi:hypothetical protein